MINPVVDTLPIFGLTVVGIAGLYMIIKKVDRKQDARDRRKEYIRISQAVIEKVKEDGTKETSRIPRVDEDNPFPIVSDCGCDSQGHTGTAHSCCGNRDNNNMDNRLEREKE